MPRVHEIAVAKLRPTQITVGMIEVRDKEKEIKEKAHDPHRLKKFIAGHEIPVVAGRKERFYLVDHHHLARALFEAGVPEGSFHIVDDLSALDEEAFWREMEQKAWVHPYDEQGRKCGIEDIPHHVHALRDDPYRSLAGYVRKAGGFAKSPTPFAEFLWADYFRTRIPLAEITHEFQRAVEEGTALARSPAAANLPGYRAA